MALFNITGRAVSGGIEIQSTVVGLEEAIRTAKAFGERAVREMGGALYREGEAIMADSKPEVPVDTGTLRDSGHVQLPQYDGASVTVELGYGGPATPYALRQHEELEFRHRVGKAKFLQDPFNRHLRGIDERLAADLHARLGG